MAAGELVKGKSETIKMGGPGDLLRIWEGLLIAE